MKHVIIKALAFVSIAPLAAPATAQTDFDKVEIRAEQIAPGVAVLFGAGGNIGVSHGADGTVIIDDQFAPLSGKIEKAVADLGASPVKFVVNTHWHFDHTGGNENFGKAGATIFAHQNVRVRMAGGGTVVGNVSPPGPKDALPVVTYDQGMRFNINDDTIALMYLGGGHTDGDSVVMWKEKNVVHMGDMFLNFGSFPFVDRASGGDVYNLMRSLDLVLTMIDGETKVIPGHGPMSDKAGLVAWRAMIGQAVERVEALHKAGKTLEEAVAVKPLADFNRETGFINGDAFVTVIWGHLAS